MGFEGIKNSLGEMLNNKNQARKNKKEIRGYKNPERNSGDTIKIKRADGETEIQADPKEDEPEEDKMTRRDFLKWGVAGAGAIAGTTGIIKGIKKVTELPPELQKKEEEAVEEDESREDSPSKDIEQKVDTDDEVEARYEKGEKESMKEDTDRRELLRPDEIARQIVISYKSKEIQERIPRDILTPDFLLAQEFQESRCNKNKTSVDRAKGVLQVTAIATVEDIRYLKKLEKKKIAPDYNGPSDIDLNKAEKVGDIYLKDEESGRAAGILYELSTIDPEYITEKRSKLMKGKNSNQMQELVLAMYIEGPDALEKQKFNWLGETKQYIELVSGKMDQIVRIRKWIARRGLNGNDNELVKIMLWDLDRAEFKKLKLDDALAKSYENNKEKFA